MFKNKKFILPANRLKLCGNCVFPQNFLTRKLSEITVFYTLPGWAGRGLFRTILKIYDGFFLQTDAW